MTGDCAFRELCWLEPNAVISRIPTPNALVDLTLWPVVKVTLGENPGEDEYRVALGRLRALRARGAPHFIIVDARELREVPPRYVEMRILTFVFETAELGQNGAVGVAVIAERHVPEGAVRALQRACNRTSVELIVRNMPEALRRAQQALGSNGGSLFELLIDT